MIESIGINLHASRLAGIRPRPILIAVYVLSAALAAVGGLFTVSEVMTVDVSGTGYQMELDAILAVVIGGTSLAGQVLDRRLDGRCAADRDSEQDGAVPRRLGRRSPSRRS
jgi:ribose/xylose/arabinose/galactoside ABC-type transport system permease subunit